MPDPEAIVSVVREWIIKVENDLKTAGHTLKLGKDAPTDTICFHAEQCVEKYLKALLVSRSTSFPKTHNLHVLMELVPAAIRPELASRLRDQMTECATVIRYPDAGLDISIGEARKAVAIARRIPKEVRRQLPRKALRRGK